MESYSNVGYGIAQLVLADSLGCMTDDRPNRGGMVIAGVAVTLRTFAREVMPAFAPRPRRQRFHNNGNRVLLAKVS